MNTLININSTVINSVSYRRKVMKVKFNNGRVYSFRGVPRLVFESFKKASSFGIFFNQQVKGKFLTIPL